MTKRRDFITTEECAKIFMSRSEHPENLQRLPVPRFLGGSTTKIPGFRLPSDPANCCDLCKELQNLVVRTIGPDLRFESTQALFFPSNQQFLVVKLHLPNDIYPFRFPYRRTYFEERCFYIYSHPGVLCPWHLFKPYPFQRLDWAIGRLQECSKRHACSGQDSTALPTRVIKVGRGPDEIHLQIGGFCAHYICLSHCWGSKQPLVTTKNNIDDRLACIPWKDMPLLYQDTVRLAWQLGIEYVWIDSLCIIQDSPDDWAREAGRMKDVYGNSWLTIAATSNPDCSSGILDNPCGDQAQAHFASFKDYLKYSGVTRQNESFSWLAVPADIHTCDHEKHEKGACRWPLLNRGWVLQERLLSPRVLYFATAGLIFSCEKSVGEQEESDVGYCPRPQHLGITTRDINARNKAKYEWVDAEPSWPRIIEEYSRLKLTNRDDRLSALSGLAQKVSQQLPPGTEYLAGLWSCSLFQELSWYNHQGSHRINEAPGGILTECSRELSQVHQYAPSWSWAAISAEVTFPQMPYHKSRETIFHAQICGTECRPDNTHDPTGRVSNGRIHLRGQTSPIIKSDYTLFNDPGLDRSMAGETTYFDCPMHMDVNYLIHNKIKCLPLYTKTGYQNPYTEEEQCSIGLLLQPIVGTDSEYRRVGLIYGSYRGGYIPGQLITRGVISRFPIDASLASSAWLDQLSNVEDIIII